MASTLSDLIRERMKQVGIDSKAELARQLGISATYAGDLINGTGKTRQGTYTPSRRLINKLAAVLKIESDDILAALGYLGDTDLHTFTLEDFAEIRLDKSKLSPEQIETIQNELSFALKLILHRNPTNIDDRTK